jgi:serine/threonine protein kinase
MRIMVSKQQQRQQTDAAAPNCCSSRSSTCNSTSPAAAAASSCSQHQHQHQLKVFSTASLRSKLKAALVWRLSDHDSSSSSMSTTTTSTTTTTTSISSQTLSKESSSQVDSSANYSTSSSSSSVTSSQQQQVLGIRDMLSDGAIIFKLKDLSMATENFHPARKVGNSVFRGSLHGMDVAVVVLKNNNSNKGSGEGGSDFVAEMKNLCSVHHTNLVKLIGGCINVQHGQIYLVYEFIASGNLRQYLHSQYSPGFSGLPTWTSRLQVVLDVAKGLEYLHHHTHAGPFVHKHLKSSNILLDTELHAQIAYFGVVKIRDQMGTSPAAAEGRGSSRSTPSTNGELRDQRDHAGSDRHESSSTRAMQLPGGVQVRHTTFRQSHSIRISGTHGYMAPEEKAGGLITPKLDVFAFGVILLEIMSGKEAVSFCQTADQTGTNTLKKTHLPDVIRSILADKEPGRRLRAWMDPLLRDSAPLDYALKTAELAKDCVDPDPNLRPNMSKVAFTLSKILMNSQAQEKSILAAKSLLTTMEPR